MTKTKEKPAAEVPTPVTSRDVEWMHIDAIQSMTTEQKLVIAREILAHKLSEVARAQGKKLSRRDALDGVFRVESQTRNDGAKPHIDFLYPLDIEIPLWSAGDA